MGILSKLFTFALCSGATLAAITATNSDNNINISNNRLAIVVSKSAGTVSSIRLDGQELLGGGRLYLDCHCDGGFWNGGTGTLLRGTDSTGTQWAGVKLGSNFGDGHIFETYFFLRDGETGLHSFGRAAYPRGGALGEMRFLFRPNGNMWNHLSSSDDMWSVIPTGTRNTVQDTTYQVPGGGINERYRRQMADHFSKYMFSESWENHTHHGLYSDGTGTSAGVPYGAWLVMNTKDTFFNGPKWSDLTVDGIVYNYVVSNHHGNGNPDMAGGFDRTFGPSFYYFNKGVNGSTIHDLRRDAARFADPTWNAQFYDSIAQHVPNYVPTSGRGIWLGKISLPLGASKVVAVLSSNGRDFQDNNFDTKAYQYWGFVKSDGTITLPRVKAGTYRLTVYGDDFFGQYVQENVVIRAGETTSTTATWTPESAGAELWRIGTPDRSCGEFRHGAARDTTRENKPNEYRLYWAVHDFPRDFPNGVNFHVGRSNPATDFNYIHWSVFGGKANSIRTTPYYTNVNEWTVTFDATAQQLQGKTRATFTIQLAGVKTSAGNNDRASKSFANLPYTVTFNGNALPVWTIPSTHSSSCGARSAASCYVTGNKWTFNTSLLKVGLNTIKLALPPRAVAPEDAILPESTYLQYDALRLEVA